MQPSEKYAVDYTDDNGLKWTKTISALYPSLGAVDNSIGLSKYDAEIMRKIYRKPDTFNPIYDNAITIGGLPGRAPDVIKYYQRSGYPSSDVNINSIIVNASTADGGAYAIGVNDDASGVINRASMGSYRILRDTEYNKMLFNVRVREMSFTTHTNVIQKDLYDDPTYTDKNLKDIDDDKYYSIFYHLNGKVWNGSSWVDSPINPAYICSGSDTQTIQGAGSVFNNTFITYSAAPLGTGQNIDLLTSTSNYYWSGENFNSKMNNVHYCLGLSEDITLKGSWTNNPDTVYGTIRQWLIDYSIAPNVRVNFEICRELVPVGNDSAVLLTQTMSAYLDNDNNLAIWGSTIHTFFMVKGSSLNKMIAGFGLYYLVDENASLTGITPDTLHNSSAIWVGEMSADGTTTGRWIRGADIENYTGYNKDGNIVNPDFDPSGGGGGSDDDDPSDDQAWGGAYSGAGAFSKFYLCTATDLANLRTWFGGGGGGDQIPDGFDPMGQVLGLLQYPVSISGTALSPDEITFRSGKTVIHTGVNADRSTGGFLHLDCGSVEIPRRMQQRGVPFLDFETSLEIYVPFCGTAPLDVQTCVGKTLTCDMYVATATGDVSAVIAAGGHPVAYMSGNMAESLPISSSGYGMYLAACKSTWGNGVSQVMNQLTGGTTSTIKNVNQAALNETLSYSQTGGYGHSELLAESYNNPAIGRGMAGAASAKGVAAIGLTTMGLNIANAASTGYEQYQRVKNASYTSVSGSFTSCAAWNYPFTPYVKITRPHKQIPTGGRGDYKHTAAIPLVETRSLSGAPGLTTCVNPDVSGISNATAQEKDIIYRALVNGVIV